MLAPAGSMEKLRIALLYGADAVYIGGTEFGLRAYASNFDIAEIAEAAAFAQCAQPTDLPEGIEAFFAKRPAAFQGR